MTGAYVERRHSDPLRGDPFPGGLAGAAGFGPHGPGTRVGFRIRRSALVLLLLKNALLTVLTLGIYRFWARTNLRRMLWQSVSIDGEAFAYTGRGIELFKGFLLALVVLVPLFGAFALASYLFQAVDPIVAFGYQLSVYLIAIVLVFVAGFTARRYLLTRTVWAGLAFGQDGSALRYALFRVKWGLLVVLTLGFAKPYVDIKVNRYLMNATRFGTETFVCEATSRGLYGTFLASWLVGLVTVFTYIGILSNFAPVFGGLEPGAIAGAIALLVILGVLAALLAMRYRIAVFRNTFHGLRIAGATVACDVRLRSFAGVVAGYVLLLVGGLAVAAFAIFATVMAAFMQGAPDPAMLAGVGVGTLLWLVLVRFLGTVWFHVEVLRKYCQGLRIDGVATLRQVMPDARPGPRSGEGLADALGEVGI